MKKEETLKNMSQEETLIEKRYKFRDLKTYASTDWLAESKKRYRQVFDRLETTYIYAELSFHNKYFDIDDWEVNVELRCYAVKKQRKEICVLPFRRKVSKYDAVGYIREGWGNKQEGVFWKKGAYYWEAWIEGEKVGIKYFYVEEAGRPLSKTDNPYCQITSLRMYEGSYDDDDIPELERQYMTRFYGEETRYVYAEIMLENLLLSKQWQCELFIKFYNDARELKGQVVRLHKVEKDDNGMKITAGWGSNVKGSWHNDTYTVEIIFGDYLLASKTFWIGDVFEEEKEIEFNNHSTKETAQEDHSRIKLFQVPIELRTAFQQYLLFFKDYVRSAKHMDIEYTVTQVSEGLEIYINAETEEDLQNIREYFNEYLNFARENFVGIINVEGNPKVQEVDILRMRIEQQVNNLNMELKYKDLHIKMLEATIQEAKDEKKILLGTIESAFQAKVDAKIQGFSIVNHSGVRIVTSPAAQLRQDCKQLVQSNQISQAFEILADNPSCRNSFHFNDLLLLQNQWAALCHEKQLGQISYEMSNTQRNFIIHSLLSLIDKIQ